MERSDHLFAQQDKNAKENSFNGKTTDSLTEKLLLRSIRSRLKRIVTCIYEQSFDEMPLAVLIDPTTQCNMRCAWCIDRYCIGDAYIPKERVFSLLEELKELDIMSIVYGGGGEPLLHQDITAILKKTMQIGIDYAICTNGILLNTKVDELVSSSKWCRISLDASGRDTYRRIHKSDFYSKVIKNVSRLVTYRNAVKSPTTIGISFIVMDENYSDIPDAARRAKDIGCDFIQFKPLISYNGQVRKEHFFHSDSVDVIAEFISKAKAEENNDFSVLITNSLKNVLSHISNNFKVYTFCYAQQIIPLITPTGLYICPNWRGVKDKKIGNILENSFSKIWQSLRNNRSLFFLIRIEWKK